MTGYKGGKETFLINVYQKLLESNDYAFTFIAYDETIAYEDYLAGTGADVVHLPPRNEGLLRHLAAMVRLFKKKHFDVVWSHKTTLSACELLFFSKLFGVKKRIVHSHSSANMGGRFTLVMHTLNKKLIRWIATDFLACSESAAKWFYSKNGYTIIKNGIDVRKFAYNPETRSRIREQLGLASNFVIGHVGRFGVEKNHKKLISVFHEIVRQNPDSRLILCGDGEERRNIENQISEYGLDDKVLLLGTIDNVHEVLQAFDVLVMPSIFEGLPFALLEAQAAGLPCVVSDTVSKESDITDLLRFLPLTAPDETWSKEIINCRTRGLDNWEELIAQGYDINTSISLIENLLKN